MGLDNAEFEGMANPNSEATRQMLLLASVGDRVAWDELLGCYHDRLRRMVVVRLNPRLQGRFDPSDVLQDTYLDASTRLVDYLVQPKYSFFLWMRYLVVHHLGRLHRDHLGRRRRDATREISLDRDDWAAVSSEALAEQLVDVFDRASEQAIRAERRRRLQETLESMDPMDREILSLRHFEQLTRAESAQTLGISLATASKRYLRALERLRECLAGLPGGLEGL